MNPYGYPPGPTGQPGLPPGTPPGMQPGMQPMAQPMPFGQQPFGQQPFGQQPYGQQAWGQQPFGPGGTPPAGPGQEAVAPLEQSYIENILRWNRNRPATLYATFENNPEWAARVFNGKVETAGRDHVIMSDEQGMRYIIPMVNVDYLTMPGELAYIPPRGPGR